MNLISGQWSVVGGWWSAAGGRQPVAQSRAANDRRSRVADGDLLTIREGGWSLTDRPLTTGH